MQPRIDTLNGSSGFPASIEKNTTYTLGGVRFKGTSEASGGNGFANSPTNYPRVYLQFMDSGNFMCMGPSGRLIDVTTSEYPMTSLQWQNADTSISFTTPADLPSGYYLLTVVANAVPSDAKIVLCTAVLAPTKLYTTRIGSAESWQWLDLYSGNVVNVGSGTPEYWQWQLSVPSSGRKVPQGAAPGWIWDTE
jgi:hypothetical protein